MLSGEISDLAEKMTAAPQSLRNLVPFQAGKSGNPAGRPKNAPVVTPRLRYYSSWSLSRLATLLSEHEDMLPIADIIAIGTLLKAGRSVDDGDKARDQVMNRLDGMQGADKGELNIHTAPTYVLQVIGSSDNVQPLG